jgi:hypothetical protein
MTRPGIAAWWRENQALFSKDFGVELGRDR